MNFETRARIIENTIDKMGHEGLEKVLESQIKEILNSPQSNLAEKDLVEIQRDLMEEMDGYGPILPFFRDPLITEILIDSPSEIYIEKGGKLQKSEAQFASEKTFHRLIKKLLHDIDRVADQRHPMVDGTLADGSRVHICLPPVSAGPVVSIRRHAQVQWSLETIQEEGMFSKETYEKLLTKINERANILICGATGCGKTTFLRSLINKVPEHERVITVEDTSELALTRPNTVSLLTRISLENYLPSVTLNDLLKNALRMRPDRLVVGEIRSEEALVFLDAVSTGHTGSMSSIHGSSPSQGLSRLEHLVSRAAPQWSMESIRKLIYEGVDLVISLERKNKSRQVQEIAELAGLESFGYLLDSWPI